MAPSKPVPGQVIRYSYLWSDEHFRGREEGSKDRPCVIVLCVTKRADGLEFVTVLPITHSPPTDLSLALEIPHRTKIRLGLDDARSWIVLSEANQFHWPGPDLRPVPGVATRTVLYGLLPLSLLELTRSKFLAIFRSKRLTIVPRSE